MQGTTVITGSRIKIKCIVLKTLKYVKFLKTTRKQVFIKFEGYLKMHVSHHLRFESLMMGTAVKEYDGARRCCRQEPTGHDHRQ